GLARIACGASTWLAVTLGREGVLFIEDGAVAHLPAFAIETVDTLGAGDVWHGAFALALAEGQSERAAIRFASAAAAIKCTRFGGRAGAPERAEIEAFLAQRG
ncbi:MAG: PfkB family carbohydrate kinase, partial [Bosea sp. (in: a-proteobacteria)]|nr:PfkB family carbohydrate kinase [Bosea sp. (in: a-proteobacteria)]